MTYTHCRIFQFRCYAKADDFHHLNLSLEVGIALLEKFEKYFEIDYPLPKLGTYIFVSEYNYIG